MTVRLPPQNALHYSSFMRSFLVLVPLVCAIPLAAPAQKPEPPGLGMTCSEILQMSSADWVARYTMEKSATSQATMRALAVYGECYQVRTNRLAASLGKSSKGPGMGARENFRDFEQALKDFTAKALAATNPPADSVKTATAALYEKQFRYDFYHRYMQQAPKPPAPPAKTPATRAGENLDGAADASAPVSPARSVPPAAAQEEDPGPMTKAKNRFGELLDALPEDKLREIHKAFGKIFSGAPVSDAAKLAAYHYAIFCLEPTSATPFSPPPF
jgi:hypothetical protein